jgi:positive regulator of sigma E activity
MEEIGKVIKTNKSKATVLIELPDSCDSCEFSDFCRIDKNSREIVCKNDKGAKTGDIVKIGTKNKNFYTAIFFYFIFPLFFLLSGVLSGKKIWKTDLAGFLLGIGVFIFYFSVFVFIDKHIVLSGRLLPEILSIKEKTNNITD